PATPRPIPPTQPNAAASARPGPPGRPGGPTQGKANKLAHTPAGLPTGGPQKLEFEDSFPLFSKAEPAGEAVVKPGDASPSNATPSARPSPSARPGGPTQGKVNKLAH